MTKCDMVGQVYLKIDFYRQSFKFLLPDNNESYRTSLGATLSLLTILTMLAYGSYKFILLSNKENYQL